MGRLDGKVAIVTGGASGIGRAICRQFTAQGCRALAIFDVDRRGADETLAMLDGGTAGFAYDVDVGDLASVEAAVARFAAEAGGPPDILVNNVGWDQAVWFVNSTHDLWEKLIHINFKGVLNTCWTVLKPMVEAGKGGRVINVASDAGRLGAAQEAVYSGCKGAVITFTKALAREHSRHDILCNVVSPGATLTPGYENVRRSWGDPDRYDAKNERQIPLRRLGKADEVASMVTFLAGDEASYVQGQIISVSGGLTMAG